MPMKRLTPSRERDRGTCCASSAFESPVGAAGDGGDGDDGDDVGQHS